MLAVDVHWVQRREASWELGGGCGGLQGQGLDGGRQRIGRRHDCGMGERARLEEGNANASLGPRKKDACESTGPA